MALATRPKQNSADRKRHGGHHRRDKRYMRSYWPYLPMLLIVGLGILVNSAWSQGGVLGSKSDFSAASLLEDTNAQRLARHEPGLALNVQLAAAAQAKAEDMVRNDYWAHDSPDGKTPWTFIDAAGYQYRSAGENLAYGFASAGQSVAGWMGSPEHRANILDAGYQDVGFGVATSPDYLGQGPQTIVVAEYGQPVASSAAAAPGSPTANNPAATNPASNVLGAEAAARPVSRIQVLAGNNAEWALVAVIAISGGAMALFTLRHGYRFHRLLSRGEAFVVHHPYLDIAIVFLVTAGCVLTRASGIIR